VQQRPALWRSGTAGGWLNLLGSALRSRTKGKNQGFFSLLGSKDVPARLDASPEPQNSSPAVSGLPRPSSQSIRMALLVRTAGSPARRRGGVDRQGLDCRAWGHACGMQQTLHRESVALHAGRLPGSLHRPTPQGLRAGGRPAYQAETKALMGSFRDIWHGWECGRRALPNVAPAPIRRSSSRVAVAPSGVSPCGPSRLFGDRTNKIASPTAVVPRVCHRCLGIATF